jgi:hypothetical protein
MAAEADVQDANEVIAVIEEIGEISNPKEHPDPQNPVDEEDPALVKEARAKLPVKEAAGKKI